MSENTSDSVAIERMFDAPIDTVWQLWTDGEQFKKWYGPMGASIPVANLDLRVGGKRHVCMEMQMPDRTMKMWFAGEHLEIEPNTRLVYTEYMADEDGNAIPPEMMGMPEGTPQSTQVIVELEEVDGKTKMKMQHVGVPAGSPGEGGWNMAFDKLAQHLAG